MSMSRINYFQKLMAKKLFILPFRMSWSYFLSDNPIQKFVKGDNIDKSVVCSCSQAPRPTGFESCSRPSPLVVSTFDLKWCPVAFEITRNPVSMENPGRGRCSHCQVVVGSEIDVDNFTSQDQRRNITHQSLWSW